MTNTERVIHTQYIEKRFTMNMFMTSVLALTTSTALAGFDAPNSHSWPMEHIRLSLVDGQVDAHANEGASVDMLLFEGEQYSGAASSLNDSYYSDQYGWVADGFISLNAGEFMWIQMIDSSVGLNVYEGGMRPMSANHTYDAILGTDTSSTAWMWSGLMTHNWYSADELGTYQATYEIFIGDIDGNALSTYTSDTVTLNFNAVPSPSSALALGLGGLVATRRRRA
ncbi:MAG: hypothetical protein AB8C13_02840 [Phycisphaerales bacterium]